MRELMKKYPNSKIWDKVVKSWSEADKLEFLYMQNGSAEVEVKVIKKRTWVSNEVRVMRISDEKIYTSISECRRDNGFYKVQMEGLLIEGNTFKKI